MDARCLGVTGTKECQECQECLFVLSDQVGRNIDTLINTCGGRKQQLPLLSLGITGSPAKPAVPTYIYPWQPWVSLPPHRLALWQSVPMPRVGGLILVTVLYPSRYVYAQNLLHRRCTVAAPRRKGKPDDGANPDRRTSAAALAAT